MIYDYKTDICPQCGNQALPQWTSLIQNGRRCQACGHIEERHEPFRAHALSHIKTDLGLAHYILGHPDKTSAYMQDWAVKIINRSAKGKIMNRYIVVPPRPIGDPQEGDPFWTVADTQDKHMPNRPVVTIDHQLEGSKATIEMLCRILNAFGKFANVD